MNAPPPKLAPEVELPSVAEARRVEHESEALGVTVRDGRAFLVLREGTSQGAIARLKAKAAKLPDQP